MTAGDTNLTNAVLSGTLSVAGATTLTGAVTAPGGVTGPLAGNTVGQHRHTVQELTATGNVTITSGVLLLNHATTPVAAAMTIAPTAGDEMFIVDNSATGTAGHTVKTPTGVTFDGTNNTATLNALGEALHIVAISAARWLIIANVGTVGLSST
jgi:hypothetical protein